MITTRTRKFHDPWGNKRGNRCAAVIRHQYLVGKSSLSRSWREPDKNVHNVNEEKYFFDSGAVINHTGDKYVLCSKYGVERLRR